MQHDQGNQSESSKKMNILINRHGFFIFGDQTG